MMETLLTEFETGGERGKASQAVDGPWRLHGGNEEVGGGDLVSKING